MKKRRISFYAACYLKAQDYEISINRIGKTRASFFVGDSPMVEDDLKAFNDDEVLQNFVKGVIDFRKQYGEFWNEQRQTQDNQSPIKTVINNPAPPENNGHS